MAQQKIKMSPFLLGAITNSLGRLPCTPYDLTKIKKLIDFYPVNFWTDEIPDMVIEGAGNFSCIGKMPNLHTLIFSNSICTTFFINNFSFLADCQKVKILDMTNTNFSDCRLLLSMPCLHKVLLPTEEQLIHTEVLDTLVNHNVQVFLMDPQAHKAAEYSINIKYWNHGFGMQDDSFVLLKYLADKGKAAISVTELFSDLGLDKMQGDFKQTRDLLKKTNIKYAINIITDLAALLLECKINQTVNLNKLAWRNIKSAVSEICITATPEEHALINKTLMDFASEPSAYDLSEVYNKNYLQKFALLCKELRKELYNKR